MTRQNLQRCDRVSADPFDSSRPSAAYLRWQMASIALIAVAALSVSALFATSHADPRGLAGSWRGSGWVTFSSGKKERARCRARYSRSSGKSYTLKASCATSSAKATQTATVHEVSKNRFRGSFYNPEYNVRGSIRVVLKGRSQSVTLSGDGANASIQLRR